METSPKLWLPIRRLVRQSVVPLVIAMLCTGLLTLLQWLRPTLVVPIEITAADYLFVREEGPHWGRRRVREDIVLVLIDAATTQALDGALPTYEEDVQLYQLLVAAGARVIADTRMAAASNEAAMTELRPLLAGMSRVRADATLFRDLWIPANTPVEEQTRWAPFLAPIVADMHPNVHREYDVRLFPLTTFMNGGPTESMPLRIFRAAKGLRQATNATTDSELKRCGIFTSWAPRRDPGDFRWRYPPYYHIGDLQIPWYSFSSSSSLVPPAAFWVSYDAAPTRFQRISYHEVLQGRMREQVAGKIVILGIDAQIDSSGQACTIPSSLQQASMAEVMGAATQTLLDGRFLRDPAPVLKIAVLFCLTVAMAWAASHLRPAAALLTVASLLVTYLGVATVAYRSGWWMSVLLVPTTALLSGVFGGTYQLFLARRSRSRIVDLFGRYVPRAVVQQLVQMPQLEALAVGGKRRDVSVMFADIRGFTSFSDQLAPESVLAELNSLLDGMVACTFELEGTLDKFIGDAILVLFNAPLEQPDHPRRAIETALRIQQKVADHPSGLAIGIGIHTGAAVVGNVGTPERMEYTAIGSTVNIASRLCDAAKPGEIVVSDDVAAQVEHHMKLAKLPPIRVKGIDRELTVHRVLGRQGQV